MQTPDRPEREAREIRAIGNWQVLIQLLRIENITIEILSTIPTTLPWFRVDLIQRNIDLLDRRIWQSRNTRGLSSSD